MEPTVSLGIVADLTFLPLPSSSSRGSSIIDALRFSSPVADGFAAGALSLLANEAPNLEIPVLF